MSLDLVQLLLEDLADSIKPSYDLSLEQIKKFPNAWESLNTKTRSIFLTYPCSTMIFDFLKSIHDYNFACQINDSDDQIEFIKAKKEISLLGYNIVCPTIEFVEKGKKNFPIIEYLKVINVLDNKMKQLISSVWGNKYDDIEREFTWVMVLEAADVDFDEIIEMFAFFDYKELTGHTYLKEIDPAYYKDFDLEDDGEEGNEEGFSFFEVEPMDSLFATRMSKFKDDCDNGGYFDDSDKKQDGL